MQLEAGFINMIEKIYQSAETQKQMHVYLKSAPAESIVLTNIFEKETYEAIQKIIQTGTFTHVKIPDKYSYALLNAEKILELNNILQNPEWASLLEAMIGKKIRSQTLKVKRFAHKDYTLIHDEQIKQHPYEFCIWICTNPWSPEWGGNKIYEKNEQAYTFSPINNTLALMKNNKHDHDFIQYINHTAKQSTYILIEGEIQL